MRLLFLTLLCINDTISVVFGDVSFEMFKTTEWRYADVIHDQQTRSVVECLSSCSSTDECQSVNFQPTTGSCELVSLPLAAVSTYGAFASGWSVYSKNEWMLTFKGCTGNGHDVYASYVSGLNAISDDAMCIQSNVAACSQSNQHFRSDVLDSWNFLGVTQVKYAMYKNDIEVAYIIFDGTGSTITDWFSLSRVINTTWTGLWDIPLPWFSLEGTPGRKFFINNEFKGCENDQAFSVSVINHVHGCSYDGQAAYPTYLYSTSPSGGIPEYMTNMDVADYIAVYIMT